MKILNKRGPSQEDSAGSTYESSGGLQTLVRIFQLRTFFCVRPEESQQVFRVVQRGFQSRRFFREPRRILWGIIGAYNGFSAEEDSHGNHEESYWIFWLTHRGFSFKQILLEVQKNLIMCLGGQWGVSSQKDSLAGTHESYDVGGIKGFSQKMFAYTPNKILVGVQVSNRWGASKNILLIKPNSGISKPKS